jgi:hypothetical protein
MLLSLPTFFQIRRIIRPYKVWQRYLYLLVGSTIVPLFSKPIYGYVTAWLKSGRRFFKTINLTRNAEYVQPLNKHSHSDTPKIAFNKLKDAFIELKGAHLQYAHAMAMRQSFSTVIQKYGNILRTSLTAVIATHICLRQISFTISQSILKSPLSVLKEINPICGVEQDEYIALSAWYGWRLKWQRKYREPITPSDTLETVGMCSDKVKVRACASLGAAYAFGGSSPCTHCAYC